MKKLSFGIVTIMLLLAIMLPLSVDAATLTTKTTEMKVGDIIEIEVNADNEVESMQFDLQYDSSKYEYVVGSATTDGKLDATDSNYMATNRIRVSAFDLNGGKAKTVKMKFKAREAGESVPFNIVGLVEIGENGEAFKDSKLTVKQIIGGKEIESAGSEQYVDKDGKAITQLPQTGAQDAIRIYGDLIPGKNVVAYALPYSDDTISIESVKAQFGNEIIVNDSDSNGILGTGETFILNGETYTILIYGDINGDGKVTTLDALKTRKADVGTIAVDAVETEALDVVKDASKDNDDKANALAAQAFILRKQYKTQNNTIIDVYPVESGDVIDEINGAKTPGKTFRYEDIALAMISSANSVNIEENMLTYEAKLDGAIVDKDIAEVTYRSASTGTFEMKLYATRTGNYEITPMVVGADVEGGVVRGEAIPITITDSKEVSEIEITDMEGNVIPENETLSVIKGREKQFKINFKHIYYKKDGVTVAEKINITDMNSNIAKIDNNNTALESATWEGNPINGMKLKAAIPQAGTNLPVSGTIKITVNNSNYGAANKERTVTVEVGEAKKIGIDFNGTELSKDVTAVSKAINLYKDNKTISSESNDTEELRNSLYTIVPIQIRDEAGTSSILKGDIVEGKENDSGYEGKVVIYETGDTQYRSIYDIQIAYFKKENGVYVEKERDTDEVDYIGIALTTRAAGSLNEIDEDTGKTPLETLKEGLTIEYDIASGRKSAQVSFGGIYENGNNLFNTAAGISLTSDDEANEGKVEPVEEPAEKQQETTPEVKKAPQKVMTKKEEETTTPVESDKEEDKVTTTPAEPDEEEDDVTTTPTETDKKQETSETKPVEDEVSGETIEE